MVMFTSEFQLVVLAAGNGSRMSELTATKPKCLLPIGSKPLIWYPLYNFQAYGFTEAIVVVLDSQKTVIQTTLEKSDLDIKLEYVTIPDDADLGTAGSLRLVHEKYNFRSNVVVVSCDLITNVNLAEVFNAFRSKKASLTALLLPPRELDTKSLPGPKYKQKAERDIIVIDSNDQMTFFGSASDFDEDVAIPIKRVQRFERVNILSNLIDAHMYIIQNWVVEYLKDTKKFTSFKGDLLPFVIKKQLVVSALQTEDIFNYTKDIKCFVYRAPKDSYSIRVNTLPAFWSANKEINSKWAKFIKKRDLLLQHPKAEIKSTQVDNECVIWENAKLDEKTSFKNSVIGAGTKVSSFTRVFNCVVMNNVKIGEKVVLENSIVCDDVVINNGAKIKGCIIGNHYELDENSEHSNEVLTLDDGLMI